MVINGELKVGKTVQWKLSHVVAQKYIVRTKAIWFIFSCHSA